MTHLEQDSFESQGIARQQRADVSLTCEIRQGARPWARVALQDISESGFRIDWRPCFDERSALFIRIPGLQLLTSHLRWKRENWIGCEFEQRLHPAVFDYIVRQSQQEG